MTVIAIGDFDGTEIETMIRERFSTLPQPEDPRPLATFEIPAYDGARYKVITDPEFPNSFIQIYLKRDAKDLISGHDYRDILISSLYSRMLNTRLDERTRETDAPFLSAGAGNSSFVRPIEFYAYKMRAPKMPRSEPRTRRS